MEDSNLITNNINTLGKTSDATTDNAYNNFSSREVKIVVIDDNFSIREVIKSRLERIEKNLKVNFKIYSSSNGVEGLGFVYTVNPDVIVIDSTLPKYSGREVVEFIQQNDSLKDKKVIVVDGVDAKDIYPVNFSVLNKENKEFLDKLEQEIENLEQIDVRRGKQTKHQNLQSLIEKKVIKWSTLSDKYLLKKERTNFLSKRLMLFPWLVIQFIESFYYTIFRLIERQIPEESIEQKQKDILMYRVKVYPTLITLFTGLITLLFQLFVFIGGGIVIFNTRIDPALALQSGEMGIEFNSSNLAKFQYDQNLIQITDSGLKLKELITEIPNEDIESEQPIEDIEVPVEDSTIEELTPPVNEQPKEEIPIIEQPIEETPTIPVEDLPAEPNQVLGVETTTITYSTAKPSITLMEGIEYTNLIQIIERSNLNDDATSVKLPEEVQDMYTNNNTKITYQLSPDGINWYYLPTAEASSDSTWSRTEQDWSSSNTIQEVNQYLNQYEEAFGSGILYLRIFLQTENLTETPILRELVIDRDTSLLTEIDNTLPVEPKLEETIVTGLDWNLLEPVIFNASFYNGNKLILGKVLLKDKSTKGVYSVSLDELALYEAQVYYSNADQATKNLLIGKTELYINSRGEIEFLLETPDIPGGFVTAEITPKKIETEEIVEDIIQEEILPEDDSGVEELIEPEAEIIVPNENVIDVSEESVSETLDEPTESTDQGLDETIEDLPSDASEDIQEVIKYELTASSLAKPVENSTFTVDSTGDQADAVLNGVCLTGTGTCTLRAAIAEANNVGGSDNIYFNIPTSDTGYRDYDNPDTASSGDSTGGDDYWTIRPGSALPQVTGTTIIDGNTQTTNQGDFNGDDSEIELNGIVAGGTNGLVFASGATSSTLNEMIINNFSSSTLLDINSDGFALTNSYIGPTADGLGTAANSPRVSIKITGANNVMIGNTTSDGNVIAGSNVTGTQTQGDISEQILIDCGLTGSAKSIDISGNIIGMGKDGSTTNTKTRSLLSATGECDLLIGGDNINNRNIIGNGQFWSVGNIGGISILPPDSENFLVEIYNNFIGTDITGQLNRRIGSGQYNNMIQAADGIMVYDDDTYNPATDQIFIGELNKGNLFRFEGIKLFNRSARIVGNTFADSTTSQTTLDSNSIHISSTSNTEMSVYIANNAFGQFVSDPNLGIDTSSATPNPHSNIYIYTTQSLYDITIEGNEFANSVDGFVDLGYFGTSSPIWVFGLTENLIIKNNYIHDHPQVAGIRLYNIDDANYMAFTDISTSQVSIAGNKFENNLAGIEILGRNNVTIGGTAPLAGSQCNSIEANCFINNGVAGIVNRSFIPLNEATLFSDNDFGTSNGLDNNTTIVQSWEGGLELVSGSTSRVDLDYDNGFAPGLITLPMPENLRMIALYSAPGYVDGLMSSLYDYTLRNGGLLLVQGLEVEALVSTNYKYYSYTTGPDYEDSMFVEYEIDNSGAKRTYSSAAQTLKLEEPHFSMNAFSFDGNAQTNPQTSLSGFDSTNNPTADRDVGTQNYEFLVHPEVHYVDGNPIYDEDLDTYVITVDSTTDEDNVSIEGVDDGDGAYSGGGANGVDGLPNGETSLREAIIVANNFTQPVTIAFNIPTSDPGWDIAEHPNAFTISPTSTFILSGEITIDGSTQTEFTGDTNVAVTEPTEMPVIGGATTGPEIILDYSLMGSGIPFDLRGVTTIKNLGFYDLNTSHRVIDVTNVAGTNVAIQDCTFVNNARNVWRNTSGGYTNLSFTDNVVRDNATASAFFDSFEGGIDIGIIEDNQFIHNGGSVLIVTVMDGGNVSFRRNFVKDVGTVPIGLEKANIIAGANSMEIEDNTFISSGNAAVLKYSGSFGTKIQNNIIKGANGEVPIELSTSCCDELLDEGVTPNDAGDVDTGANDLQNYPEISSIQYRGNQIYRVSGVLDGNSSENDWTIEVCLSDEHPSGHGGCLESLGTFTLGDVNPSGPDSWTYDVVVAGSDGTEGSVFSTLATNGNVSTSEFSSNFVASLSNPSYSIQTYPVPLVYPINGVEIEDRTPILDWNKSQLSGVENPEVDHYDIHVDGQFYGTQNSETTQQQILSDLSLGTHTWQVIAYRVNGEETGRSVVEDFVIIEKTYGLTLEYPVNVIIDTTLPQFSWTELQAVKTGDSIEEISVAVVYDLYINEELIASELTAASYQLTSENELEFDKTYTWKIVAREKGTTNELASAEATFEVQEIQTIATEDEIGLIDQIQGDVQGNLIARLLIQLGALAVALLLAIIGALLIAGLSLLELLKKIGVLLGITFKKKKKYWGIVFDKHSIKEIPYAHVRLLKKHDVYYHMDNNSSNEIVIEQTITDEDGRYGFAAGLANGLYILEVAADGYLPERHTIRIEGGEEIIEDIGLTKREKSSHVLAQFKQFIAYSKKEINKVIRATILILMLAGFFYTLYLFITEHQLINLLFVFGYGLLALLSILQLLKTINKEIGRVVDAKTYSGIQGAFIRIYESSEQKEVLMTNASGAIKSRIGKGKYSIRVDKDGFETKQENITIGENGYMDRKITLISS